MVAFQQAVACNIWTHSWKVMGFWRFQLKFEHAHSHCECRKIYPSLPKTAQNCPNLPKSTQRRNFEIPQEIEILVFFKYKKFNPRIFHMLFLLSKNGLCMWISAYPFAENNFFGNPPQLWWIWDFAHMYLIQIRTRIWSPAIHIYIQKWFFWPLKHCCPSWVQWTKTLCLTLNVMILQSVRNECVRFSRHVDIEVSYNILRLEVLTPKISSEQIWVASYFG
jgi:hypothetical protein